MAASNQTAIAVDPYKPVSISVEIEGTAPYVQNRFAEKARQKMRETQMAGSTAKKGRKKEPRDFDADFIGAQHISDEGWYGIPAAAFRNALIDACRMVGYQMTRARMSLFVAADGYDRHDLTPLVRLVADEPERLEHIVRNATGVADIRVRPGWRTWNATLVIEFDGDQFTSQDVMNLVERAGHQVGIGEGRAFSKSSNGMGWGFFRLVRNDERAVA